LLALSLSSVAHLLNTKFFGQCAASFNILARGRRSVRCTVRSLQPFRLKQTTRLNGKTKYTHSGAKVKTNDNEVKFPFSAFVVKRLSRLISKIRLALIVFERDASQQHQTAST
jgi:hypothetical protein